jgi:hypothetical protein
MTTESVDAAARSFKDCDPLPRCLLEPLAVCFGGTVNASTECINETSSNTPTGNRTTKDSCMIRDLGQDHRVVSDVGGRVVASFQSLIWT